MNTITWVCRPGQKAKFEKDFIKNNKIYLAWEGYKVDFTGKTIEQIKNVVKCEKKTTNNTSISNWASMINIFVNEMQEKDYVLIPGYRSHSYTLARIVGNYKYSENCTLPHSRSIEILEEGINPDIFPQNIKYSLGAFRTIFKTKNSDEIIKLIRSQRID